MTDEKTCDRCDKPANTFYGANYDNQKFCREHQTEFWAEVTQAQKDAMEADGGPIPQRCPRRDEGPNFFPEGDLWAYGHGIITKRKILTCNYCGSCHPDFFMEKLQEGWQLGTTDKNYKAYLGTPEGEDVAKFYFQHLSEEQRQEFVRLINEKKITFSGGFGFSRLPYFVVVKS